MDASDRLERGLHSIVELASGAKNRVRPFSARVSSSKRPVYEGGFAAVTPCSSDTTLGVEGADRRHEASFLRAVGGRHRLHFPDFVGRVGWTNLLLERIPVQRGGLRHRRAQEKSVRRGGWSNRCRFHMMEQRVLRVSHTPKVYADLKWPICVQPKPVRGAGRRAVSSVRTTVLRPNLVQSRPNSPRLLSRKRVLGVASLAHGTKSGRASGKPSPSLAKAGE